MKEDYGLVRGLSFGLLAMFFLFVLLFGAIAMWRMCSES